MLLFTGHRPLIITMVVVVPPLWLLSSTFALLKNQFFPTFNLNSIERSRTNLSSCHGTYPVIAFGTLQ
jgi:hypothetical protein